MGVCATVRMASPHEHSYDDLKRDPCEVLWNPSRCMKACTRNRNQRVDHDC